MPKRYGNIYQKIYTLENLKLAHKRAKKDKSFYKEVKMVDSNPDYYLNKIKNMLKYKTYKVLQSDYVMFEKSDKGKIRKIFKLDYFPHRVIQHAVLIQIEDIMFKNLTKNTYSSLPNRGIHKALKELDYSLKNDISGTQYCLQLDIKKFYPSINHEINKLQYRKKFKDKDLLWLIDMLIDSLCLDFNGEKLESFDKYDKYNLHGIAIGALFSQWDGNYYMSELDHYLKEDLKVKHIFRYCDDIIVLGSNKEELREINNIIGEYVENNLKLKIKGNYKIFPVDKQGIDFVGYRHFRYYVLLRKTTSKKLIRTMRGIINKINNGGEMNHKDYSSINSYKGWLRYCDGYNLYKKWILPLEPYHKKYYEENIKRSKK